MSEHIFAVGGPKLSASDDCYVYLLAVDKPILIDTGIGHGYETIVKNIKNIGFNPSDISWIILTHCHIDHIGGAPSFKREYQLPLLMHEADATILRKADSFMTGAMLYGIELHSITVDQTFTDNKKKVYMNDVEINLLHTPGHTPGSISVFVEIDGNKILFAQDLHGPLLPMFGSNIGDWRNSMQKLLSLKPDILCEGHYGVYQPASRVERFIKHFLNIYKK